MLIDIIFAFCLNSADQEICHADFANCVITDKKVTEKKIQQCKEKLLNEDNDDATDRGIGTI